MSKHDYVKNQLQYYIRNKSDVIEEMGKSADESEMNEEDSCSEIERDEESKSEEEVIGNMISVEDLLKVSNAEFYIKASESILHRPFTNDEIQQTQIMLMDGLSREGLIYYVAQMEGCQIDINSIGNIKKYRAKYRKYSYRKRLCSLPLFGWLFCLVYLRKNYLKLFSIASNIYRVQDEEVRRERELEGKIIGILSRSKQLDEEYSQRKNELLVEYNRLNRRENELNRRENELNRRCNEINQRYEDLNHIIEVRIRKDEEKKSAYKKQIKEDVENNRETNGRDKIDIPSVYKSRGILNKDRYYTGDKCSENLEDDFYYNIGVLFRGAEQTLKSQYKNYIQFISNPGQGLYADKPVLDIGCGTGLFMDVLKENCIDVIGVDINKKSAMESIKKGHEVYITDAKTYLEDAEDNSFSAVTMLEVVEHISFDNMVGLCEDICKKIKKNGCFIMETINPYCYSKFGSFRIDPSHIQYPSPDAYKLLLEMIGFSNVDIYFYAPIDNPDMFEPLEFNYEGYFIVARK